MEFATIKRSRGDVVFDVINVLLCCIIFVLVAYPLIFVVSASLSNPLDVMQGTMRLWPVNFQLDSYTLIMQYPQVFVGYRNSLFLVVAGTSINLVMTILAAYPLSRPDLWGRGVIMKLLVFTMVFSGGMIPTFLVVQAAGLLDSLFALIIPTMISMFNLIVMRTFFMNTIPESLYEASYMDGANNIQTLFMVVLPLSKAIIAVICLFYGVAHWNQFFQAILYITSRNLQPLQVVLREIILMAQVQEVVDLVGAEQHLLQAEGLRYSLIVVASVPVLAVYPFIQRYFVKGVMIGAIKG